MAGWIKYRLNTPRAQVRMDKKEFQNLKENLIYYKAALDGAYDNLVLKYEEEFAELFMETDACIRHKYIIGTCSLTTATTFPQIGCPVVLVRHNRKNVSK